MSNLIVTILAAGNGSRMKSRDNLPKVLNLIDNEPMVVKIIKTISEFNPEKILIVVNNSNIQIIKQTIEKCVDGTICHNIIYVIQDVAKGTGDAVSKTINILDTYKDCVYHNLILNGDTPLLKYETLYLAYVCFLKKYKINTQNLLITGIELNDSIISSMSTENGRITQEDNTLKIIEYKDCTEKQKKIKLVNVGIYICDVELINICVPEIKNTNGQNEYYLTDIVTISNNNKFNVILHTMNIDKHLEIFNVNTQEQLKFIKNNLIKN